MHELEAGQDKHLVIQRRHLLALLSWNFLLDAAQNNKVTTDKRINIEGGKPTVGLKLLPFLKCVQMHCQMNPALALGERSYEWDHLQRVGAGSDVYSGLNMLNRRCKTSLILSHL